MKRFINREPEKKYNNKRTSASLAANPTTTGCPAPFDAAQAPTIYVLPQPPLIYKMNPNHHQADSLDESYQQNSTQSDLVIKECLTQPDQPKQSSLVHPDQFSQGKNVQTGQLSSNSAPEQPQQPSSGQPPSLGQPSPSSGQPSPYSSQPPPYVGQPSQYLGQPGAYQPYYGPYYGAPPGVYHYPGHYPTQAPVPSAADTPMRRENQTFRRPREQPEAEGWTGFSDKNVRAKFIRKVYIILALQLLFTLANIALFIYEPNVKAFVQKHRYLLFVAMAIFFPVYIGIVCYESVRRKYPLNIIVLIIFTIAMSYMCSTFSTIYDTDIVLMAVGICAVVCFAVTIFSFYTKFDFTSCGGILCILMLILFLFGIIAIFYPTNVMRYIYAGLGATVFTFLLAFNTQEIMGGKRYEISPEDYVYAAIQLYVDIIYIFLFLLQLLGGLGEG